MQKGTVPFVCLLFGKKVNNKNQTACVRISIMDMRDGENSKMIWGLVAVVLIAAILFGVLYVYNNRDIPAPTLPEDAVPATVTYVIDGDTVVCSIEGQEITVRLIGIDAPESVNHDESKNTEEGRLASEYTKGMLTGKKVYLEYDEEKKDQYDRTLAYVWLEGELFNKRILEDGHAVLLTIPPNEKYTEILQRAAGE